MQASELYGAMIHDGVLVKRLVTWWQRGSLRKRLALLALLLLLALLAWDASRLDLRGPPPSTLLLDRQGCFIAEVAAQGEEYGYWLVNIGWAELSYQSRSL